jgi:hypothetical protein
MGILHYCSNGMTVVPFTVVSLPRNIDLRVYFVAASTCRKMRKFKNSTRVFRILFEKPEIAWRHSSLHSNVCVLFNSLSPTCIGQYLLMGSDTMTASAPEEGRKCWLKVSYSGTHRMIEWNTAWGTFKDMDTKVRKMFGLHDKVKLVYSYKDEKHSTADTPCNILMVWLSTSHYINNKHLTPF